jgi:hypothetical protein
MVMGYGVLYEYAVDTKSDQYKARMALKNCKSKQQLTFCNQVEVWS